MTAITNMPVGASSGLPPGVGAPHESASSTPELQTTGASAPTTWDASREQEILGGRDTYTPIPAPVTTPVAATPTASASPLTPEEQAHFPAAIAWIQQELEAPEVREAVRAQLAAAGRPSDAAAVDVEVQQFLGNFATDEGQRALMDRARDEGWFVATTPAANPAWNDVWDEKFTRLLRSHNVLDATVESYRTYISGLGLDAAGLQQVYDTYSSDIGRAELQEFDEIDRGTERAALLTGAGVTAVTGGAVAVSLGLSRSLIAKGMLEMARTGTALQAGQAINVLSSMNSGAAKAALATIQAELPNAAQLAKGAGSLATSGEAASKFMTSWKGGGWLAQKVGAAGVSALAPAAPVTVGNVLKAAIGMPVGGAAAATGKGFLGFLGKWGGPIAMAGIALMNVVDIKQTMDAEGGFGTESQKKTGAAAGSMAGMSAGFLIGSFVPGVGNVAGAIIGAGLGAVGGDAGETITAVVQDVKADKGWTRNASKLTGALSGAAAGAAIGAGIGVWFAGAGAAAGALIGGIIGGAIGWFGGGAAGVAVHDAVNGATAAQPDPPSGGSAASY
ncbi:MAG: hypothetical protein JWM90_2106 [Thermoleophilia bacterium]|nr:hypothetical protein [Thermoleophilia bacterium]